MFEFRLLDLLKLLRSSSFTPSCLVYLSLSFNLENKSREGSLVCVYLLLCSSLWILGWLVWYIPFQISSFSYFFFFSTSRLFWNAFISRNQNIISFSRSFKLMLPKLIYSLLKAMTHLQEPTWFSAKANSAEQMKKEWGKESVWQ